MRIHLASNTIAARPISTTPAATKRAETSLTGLGNENTVTLLRGLERSFEVPHSGEPVERPTLDEAGPLERVRVRRVVVRALRAIATAARLGRALVEGLLVPRHGDRAQIALQRAAGAGDRRRLHGRARLRILLVGRDVEGHGEERLRLDHRGRER